MVASALIARKDGAALAISPTPSLYWQTIGGARVVVPYQNVANLGEATGTTNTVLIKGNPAFVAGKSLVPSVKGDEAAENGIISGTKTANAWPMTWSGTVNIEQCKIVRYSDTVWSNDIAG